MMIRPNATIEVKVRDSVFGVGTSAPCTFIAKLDDGLLLKTSVGRVLFIPWTNICAVEFMDADDIDSTDWRMKDYELREPGKAPTH